MVAEPFRAALETLDKGIFIFAEIDGRQVIVYANSAFCSIAQCGVRPIVGQEWGFLLGTDGSKQQASVICTAKAGGKAVVEAQRSIAPGQDQWLRIGVLYLESTGSFLGTIQDVTADHVQDELLRLLGAGFASSHQGITIIEMPSKQFCDGSISSQPEVSAADSSSSRATCGLNHVGMGMDTSTNSSNQGSCLSTGSGADRVSSTPYIGRIVYCCSAFERLTGHVSAELVGSDFRMLARHGSSDSAIASLEAAIAQEQPASADILLYTREGRPFWDRCSLSPIHNTMPEGTLVTASPDAPRRFIALHHDVTMLKAARVGHSMQDHTLRSLSEGITIVDIRLPDAPIVYVNDALLCMTGYARDEVLGRNCRMLQGLETSQEAVAAVRSAVAAGEACTVELLNYRKDGSKFWNYLSLTPVHDSSGALVSYIGIQSNITELIRRKEAERRQLEAKLAAEMAMAAKSAFLANMSHEIRTPLHGMIATSQLLLMSGLTADQRDLTETIMESGNSLLGILGDILDFSKIDHGSIMLTAEPVALRSAIEACLDIVSAEAIKKGLNLAYRIDQRALLAPLLSDASRFRQVLTNLLSNAVKFTDRGEVVVSVTVEPAGQPHGPDREQLHISVRDTGIGMHADSLGKLFQCFHQGAESMSRRYGGTGLGLAISKQLAELMEGTVWVESAPGRGSTFHFTLLATWAEAAAGLAQVLAVPPEPTWEVPQALRHWSDASPSGTDTGPVSTTHGRLAGGVAVSTDFTPAACPGGRLAESRAVCEAHNPPDSSTRGHVDQLHMSFASRQQPHLLSDSRPSASCTSCCDEATLSALVGSRVSPCLCVSKPTPDNEPCACCGSSQRGTPSSTSATDGASRTGTVIDVTQHGTGHLNPAPIALGTLHLAGDYPAPTSGGSGALVVESAPGGLIAGTSNSNGGSSVAGLAGLASLAGAIVFVDIGHTPTALQVCDSCLQLGLVPVWSGAPVDSSDPTRSAAGSHTSLEALTTQQHCTIAVVGLERAEAAIKSGWEGRPLVVVGNRGLHLAAALPPTVMLATPVKHSRLAAALVKAAGLVQWQPPTRTAARTALSTSSDWGTSEDGSSSVTASLLASSSSSESTSTTPFSGRDSGALPGMALQDEDGHPAGLLGEQLGLENSLDAGRRLSIDNNSAPDRRDRWQQAAPPWETRHVWPFVQLQPATSVGSSAGESAGDAGLEVVLGGPAPTAGSKSQGSFDSQLPLAAAGSRLMTAQPPAPLRVLVAEDNKVNQKVVLRVLQQVAASCQPDVVENGLQVLHALEKKVYDLILMDIHMPEMDGLEASRRIQQNYAASERPRIIALSADTLQALHEHCREAGIAEFIVKPFKVEDLRRVMKVCNRVNREIPPGASAGLVVT